MEPEITKEQADFFEQQTQAMFDYVTESYDRAHTQGNNILQWLFGAMAGGMGLIGTLFTKEYYCMAVGATLGVGAASYAAVGLVRALCSRKTLPPGNLAENLNGMLDDTMPRMRWRAACGVDARIGTNLIESNSLWRSVDLARVRFSRLPAWLIGGTAIAYAAKFTFVL